MKSILNNEYTYTIKNSKFISLTYFVNSIDEINKYMNDAKTKYPNATHYCYAYILDDIRKESDDGEPSGTAGIPILKVLEKNNLNHVLCIVIRYFGKIKLGAGGLVRAYTKSVTSCIKDYIVTLEDALLIQITFPYSILKNIDYLLLNTNIIQKNYNELITYTVTVSNDLYCILKNIEDIISINILKKTYLISENK